MLTLRPTNRLIRRSGKEHAGRLIATNISGSALPPAIWRQQNRHFLNMPTFMNGNSEAADTAVTDEKKIVETLRKQKPGEVIQKIERGWQNGNYPASELIVKEYLKAAASMNKLDSLNVTLLLSLIKQNGNGPVTSSKDSRGVLTPESMFVAMQANQKSTAGESVKDPFYVKSK